MNVATRNVSQQKTSTPRQSKHQSRLTGEETSFRRVSYSVFQQIACIIAAGASASAPSPTSGTCGAGGQPGGEVGRWGGGKVRAVRLARRLFSFPTSPLPPFSRRCDKDACRVPRLADRVRLGDVHEISRRPRRPLELHRRPRDCPPRGGLTLLCDTERRQKPEYHPLLRFPRRRNRQAQRPPFVHCVGPVRHPARLEFQARRQPQRRMPPEPRHIVPPGTGCRACRFCGAPGPAAAHAPAPSHPRLRTRPRRSSPRCASRPGD